MTSSLKFFAFLAVAFCLTWFPGSPVLAATVKISWSNFSKIYKERYLKHSPEASAMLKADLSETLSKSWRLDPVFSAKTSRKDPGSFAGQSQTTTYGLSQSSPWGMSVSLQQAQSEFPNRDEGDEPNKSKSAGVGVEQKLLKDGLWGSWEEVSRPAQEATIARLKIAQEARDSLLEATTAFINAQNSQTSFSAAEAALKRSEAHHELVNNLVNSGFKAKADLLVTEAALLRNQIAFEQAGNSLKQALRNLELALFWNSADGVLAVDLEEPPATLQESLSTMNWPEKTPAVELSEKQLALAETKASLASRDDLPDLSIGYDITRQEDHYEDRIEKGVDKTISLNFSMPLISGIRRYGADLAREEQFSVALSYEQTQRQIESDRKELREQIKLAERQVATSSQLQNLAAKSLEIEQQKYADGKSTVSEVSRFQEGVDQAEVSAIQARSDLLKLYLKLAHLTGSLTQVLL